MEIVATMKWSPELENATPEERLRALDTEVEKYSKWLAALPDERASGPLNNPEKALIKTYLVQKLNGKIDEVK